jgi:hypothetical protein
MITPGVCKEAQTEKLRGGRGKGKREKERKKEVEDKKKK